MPRRQLQQTRPSVSAPPDLRHVDLHLVRVLRTLLVERSVSRAARKLGQGQPQVSAALRRLRALTGDPLLIRSQRGMTPTEYGQSLVAPATRLIEDFRALFTTAAPFDPARTQRTFTIAVPDYIAAPLLGALVAALRAAAPRAKLAVRPLTSDAQAVEMLEAGDADLVIESNVVRSGHVRFAALFEDSVAAVARAAALGGRARTDVEAYLALPHVAAAPGSGTRPGLVDRALAKKGLRRNIQAWIPYLITLPEILAKTDLVFTTSRHLAAYIAAARAGLVTFVPPVPFPRIRYYQMWHNKTHANPDHEWLRDLVRAVARREIGG